MDYKRIRVLRETNDIEVKEEQLITLTPMDLILRNSGELERKAIYLPVRVGSPSVEADKWIIAKDSVGNICAVPLKKA